MLVTPLRDGMNLVAKEFVASRLDDDGVLVLSEFAGAADELGEALMVNPYDIDARGRHDRAGADDERHGASGAHARAAAARQGATACRAWTSHFLDELDRISSEVAADTLPISSNADFTRARLAHPPGAPHRAAARLRRHARAARRHAGAGQPDPALLDLLQELHHAARHLRPRRRRPRPRRARGWLGDLPVGLWAEHALWRRDPTSSKWRGRSG